MKGKLFYFFSHSKIQLAFFFFSFLFLSPACIFSFHVACCSYHKSSKKRNGSNLQGHNMMEVNVELDVLEMEFE